jgi:hypothetical protein
MSWFIKGSDSMPTNGLVYSWSGFVILKKANL